MQRIFKSEQFKLIVKKYKSGWVYCENHLKNDPENYSKVYTNYNQVVSALQRYAKKYYGVKIK